MPYNKLDTSKKIIEFVESLSVFIEHVYILEVHNGGFTFMVKIPIWFQKTFGWWLRRKIKKRVGERMLLGVTFDFEFYN